MSTAPCRGSASLLRRCQPLTGGHACGISLPRHMRACILLAWRPCAEAVAAGAQGLFQGIATLMDKHAPLPVDDALRQLGPLLAAQGQHCVLQLFAHPNKGPEASKAAPGGKARPAARTCLSALIGQ